MNRKRRVEGEGAEGGRGRGWEHWDRVEGDVEGGGMDRRCVGMGCLVNGKRGKGIRSKGGRGRREGKVRDMILRSLIIALMRHGTCPRRQVITLILRPSDATQCLTNESENCKRYARSDEVYDKNEDEGNGTQTTNDKQMRMR